MGGLLDRQDEAGPAKGWKALIKPRSGQEYPGEIVRLEKQADTVTRELEVDVVPADEPTAALDTARGTKAMEILKKTARENQTAVIVVTHDVRMVSGFDHVHHLKDGRLEKDNGAVAG